MGQPDGLEANGERIHLRQNKEEKFIECTARELQAGSCRQDSGGETICLETVGGGST